MAKANNNKNTGGATPQKKQYIVRVGSQNETGFTGLVEIQNDFEPDFFVFERIAEGRFTITNYNPNIHIIEGFNILGYNLDFSLEDNLLIVYRLNVAQANDFGFEFGGIIIITQLTS